MQCSQLICWLSCGRIHLQVQLPAHPTHLRRKKILSSKTLRLHVLQQLIVQHSYYNARKVCLFVCFSVISVIPIWRFLCCTVMNPDWHLSPWALGTCPPPCSPFPPMSRLAGICGALLGNRVDPPIGWELLVIVIVTRKQS